MGILKFSDTHKNLLIGVSDNITLLARRIRNVLEENKKILISIKYDFNIYEII